jgi:hypothetical protein
MNYYLLPLALMVVSAVLFIVILIVYDYTRSILLKHVLEIAGGVFLISFLLSALIAGYFLLFVFKM